MLELRSRTLAEALDGAFAILRARFWSLAGVACISYGIPVAVCHEIVDSVGNGDSLDVQTTTDEDGVATTQYRAEITGGVDPTIQAQLTH